MPDYTGTSGDVPVQCFERNNGEHKLVYSQIIKASRAMRARREDREEKKVNEYK